LIATKRTNLTVPAYSLAVRLNPALLLEDYIPPAVLAASKALRLVSPARYGKAGRRSSRHNQFAIVAAVAAVELFKGNALRKERLDTFRLNEKRKKHRDHNPPVRQQRVADFDHHVPVQIWQEAALELSTRDADRALALIWLGFFNAEQGIALERSFSLVFDALPHVLRRSTTRPNLEKAVWTRLKRTRNRPLTENEAQFHGTHSVERVADDLFQLWYMAMWEHRKKLVDE
jgi:hypothetical protein